MPSLRGCQGIPCQMAEFPDSVILNMNLVSRMRLKLHKMHWVKLEKSKREEEY